LSPEQLLGSVDFNEEDVVVADFEAGVGTLTRLGEEHVDTVVIVVEATPKSLEVGARAAALAAERTVGRIVVVANRIRHDADLQTVKDAFPGMEVVGVPHDMKIVEADRKGIAPIDLDPDAPAVKALVALASTLSPSYSSN
jgi:CO dehydrogenase maturation factor